MLAGQRQLLILEEIRRRGAVRVSELTELLSVSDMRASWVSDTRSQNSTRSNKND